MDRHRPLLETQRRGPKRQASIFNPIKNRLSCMVTALLACFGIAVFLYLLLASNNRSQDHHDDSLMLLHNHPSEHFCRKPRPLVCAHGGDVTAAPPNTLRAFQIALEGSANCIEVDVSMTQDGHLVALHNRDLQQLLHHISLSSGSSNIQLDSNRKLAGSLRGSPSIFSPPRDVFEWTWSELSQLTWPAKLSNDNISTDGTNTDSTKEGGGVVHEDEANRGGRNLKISSPTPTRTSSGSWRDDGPEQSLEDNQQQQLHRRDKIESLKSVLTLAMQHSAHIIIDVKLNEKHAVNLLEPGHSQSEQAVQHSTSVAEKVLEVLSHVGCGNKCLVWAKSDHFVKKVKELSPGTRTGYVVFNETKDARAAGLDEPLRLPESDVMAVHYAMASPELMKVAKRAGQGVHVWTANTVQMMRSALDAGPDAVVTGRPRDLIEALNKRRNACWRMRRRSST